MKTPLLKTHIFYIFFLGLVFFACNDRGDNSISDTVSKISEEFKKHLLSDEQVNTLKSEYTNNNYQAIGNYRISKGLDYQESRNYYYKLEVLEGYLNYVKTEAEKRNLKDVYININLGQYPVDRVIDERQNPNYKGYQMTYLNASLKNNTSYSKNSDTNPYTDISGISAMDYAGICPPYDK